MKQSVYRSPDLENTIAAETRSMENKAMHAAQSVSFTTKDDVLSGFRAFHDNTEGLLGIIGYTLQSESNRNATEKGLVSKDKRESVLEQEIANDKERELALSGYARSGGFWRKVKRGLLMALLLMLCFSDVIFNQAGMERLLMVPQIIGYALSFMLAGSIAYFAHSLVPKLSTRGFYLSLCIAAVVFLFLGYVRIAHVFTFSLHDILMVITFALISVLMFFAACRIGMRLLATKNTAEMDQAERAHTELMNIRKDLRAKEKELATMTTGWHNHEGHTLALDEYGKGLKMNCINKTKALFWEYLRIAKKHNPTSDPAIFTFTEYPFSFGEQTPAKASALQGGIIAACIALVMLCTGCVQQPSGAATDMAVGVVVDNSVSLRVLPDTASLIDFTGLRREQWNVSLTVECTTIGDIDHEPVYTHTVQPENRLLGNMVERQEKLQAFADGMQQSLNKVIPPMGNELAHSIIYRTIARSAIRVHNMPHKRRVLLVYSDLLNNDGSVSFYGKSGKKLLNNPQKLEEMFLAQVPLPDLSGLEIYFIYRPNDFSGNDGYNAASSFFADMFSHYGAITYITANTPQ